MCRASVPACSRGTESPISYDSAPLNSYIGQIIFLLPYTQWLRIFRFLLNHVLMAGNTNELHIIGRRIMVRVQRISIVSCLFLLILFVAGVSQPSAMGLSEYEDGFLVPYAYYNDQVDTVVGLVTRDADPSFHVYWSFMSQDGAQLGNGIIHMQEDVLTYSFSLRGNDGNSRPDTPGYLIFTFDSDGTLEPSEDYEMIFGNALLLSVGDAAFIPAIPLDREDYASGSISLSNLGASSVERLSYVNAVLGSADFRIVNCRYWIDPAFGASTTLVIWSPQFMGTLNGRVYAISGDSRESISVTLPNGRMNAVDVNSDVEGIPSGFHEGLIELGPSKNDFVVFSLIGSSVFSALQTLLSSEYIVIF